MAEKKHLVEIDGLYFIGIFLVILGHSHPSDWSLFHGSFYETIIVFIYIFHMPLFFFIAGFLFEHSKSLEKIGYLRWIKNKTNRLLVPYFFWSAIGFIPKCIQSYYSGLPLPYKSLLFTLIMPRAGIWGHFWFLPTIFILYAFVALITMLLKKQCHRKYTTLLLLLACLVNLLPIRTNYLCLHDLQPAFLYFSAGMLLCQLYKSYSIKMTRHQAIVGSLCLIGLITLFWHVIEPIQIRDIILSFLLISLCAAIASILPPSRFIQWISKNCMSMFLFSWFFQYPVMLLCQSAHFSWQMTSMFMFISGLILPVGLIYLYRKYILGKLKVMDLLIGIR